MRQILMTAILVAAATGAVSHAAAQAPDDVTRLKAEVEYLRKQVSYLEKKNENLEKKNKLLTQEIARMKSKAEAKPDGAGGPRNGATVRYVPGGPASKPVEFELVKCVRDSTKRTRVIFTFAVQCESEREIPIGVCKKLELLPVGLKTLNGRMVDGPGSGGKSLDVIYLAKGDRKKFQVTYEGVDEDITELDQVDLFWGAAITLAGNGKAVTFHNIKIESQ